jgi:hypothetical protein
VNETKERVIIKTKRPHIALWNPLIYANLAFAVPESHPKFSPLARFATLRITAICLLFPSTARQNEDQNGIHLIFRHVDAGWKI